LAEEHTSKKKSFLFSIGNKVTGEETREEIIATDADKAADIISGNYAGEGMEISYIKEMPTSE